MSNLWHKIEHWLGWNKGNPESHYEGKQLIMCFKCSGCGELQNCAPTNVHLEAGDFHG